MPDQSRPAPPENPPDRYVDVPKGYGEFIRVSRGTWKGKENAGVRLCFTDMHGEIKPTKKGCNFPVEKIPDIVKALESIKA